MQLPKQWVERAESYLADCEDLSLLMQTNEWTAEQALLYLSREAHELFYQALNWPQN